ncbi:hypothetical protein VKT23_004681 [Stygiomarasmius scandens]|uniref:Uncharacterized protein n=1 Tax=Marasmiellus scandens TaxID=2682957 RepID=A0ABR1K181_9AGAR
MRPESDNKNMPARDLVAAPLLEARVGENSSSYKNRCSKFFTALFSLLSEEFNKLFGDDIVDIPSALDKWKREMAPEAKTSFRNEFFKKLHEQVASKEVAEPPLVSPHSSSGTNRSLPPAPVELVDTLRKLLGILNCHFQGFNPKLVICLDEVDTLQETFHVLGQVINGFSTSKFQCTGIWVIFASTNRQMNKSASPDRVHPSQRVYKHHHKLFPPYTLFLWDAHAEPFRKMTVHQTGLFKAVIKFGRPLWYSVRSLYDNPTKMASFAKVKLTLKDERNWNMSDESQAVAALGQRFLLPLMMDNEETVDYIQDAVAQHMRVVLGTSEDGERILSSYPSEPVLSQAAAELLHSSSTSLCNAIDVLSRKMEGGMFDKGQASELVSRLLLLICRDLASTRFNHDGYTDDAVAKLRNPLSVAKWPILEPSFSYLTPIPLLDALCMLFGNAWMEHDTGENGVKMKDKIHPFRNAYISASHWVSMSVSVGKRKDMRSEDWLKYHFIRGAAVQCYYNQEDIDHVIPIAFRLDNGEIVMSCILIQIKNRKSRFTKSYLGKINITNKKICLQIKMPYVVILLNFGVQEAQHQEVETSLYRERRKGSAGVEPESIRFLAQGLSSTVFPVLDAYPKLEFLLKKLAGVSPSSADPNTELSKNLYASMAWGNEPLLPYLEWGALEDRLGREDDNMQVDE